MFPNIILGGETIDTYGLMFLLSFIVVMMASVVLRPKEMSAKVVFGAFLVNFFFAFAGACLLNIILNFGKYEGKSMNFILHNTGVAYMGGPLLGLLAFWIYCKIVKIPFLVFADYAAPFYMLDRAIGRIGCLGYGCCYGIPSGLPWAYPFNSWGVPEVVPRHPTQAYAIIAAAALFFAGRYLYKRLKEVPGVFSLECGKSPLAGLTFFCVIFGYSFLRFFNEFLRAEGPYLTDWFKVSHPVLLLFMAIAFLGIFFIFKGKDKKEAVIRIFKKAGLLLAALLALFSSTLLPLIALVK